MKFKVDTTEYARWREQRRERADKLLQRALEEAGPEQARWAARYTPPSGKSIEKYNAARENDGKYWVWSREFGREKREWEPGRRHNGRNVAQKYFQGNEIEPVLYRRKYYYLPKLAGATSNGGFRKRFKAELDRGMRYAVVVNRYGRRREWRYFRSWAEAEPATVIHMRGLFKAAWGMALDMYDPKGAPGRLKEPANIKKLRKASPALTRKFRLNEIAMRHPGTGVFVFSLGNAGWGYQYPAGNFKQMVENQATRKAQRIVDRKLKEYAKFGVW